MRLLTEEVSKVIDNAKMADIVDGRFSSKPYAEEVISITLKAVGEWLEKHKEFGVDDRRVAGIPQVVISIAETDWEAFLRGEMPTT